MTSIVFDTHEAAKTYEGAGFSKEQVEALVEVSRRTANVPDISQLVTKTDLVATKADLRVEIEKSKVQIIGVLGTLMTILTVASTLLGKLIH